MDGCPARLYAHRHMGTDREWEKWGRQDPYFGVLTDDRYRSRNMDAAAKEEFFRTGAEHVDAIRDACRRYFGVDLAPRRALDFGCGTGRVLIPLAAVAGEVVGVDVSETMLAEAAANCAERSVGNAVLELSDDSLSRLSGTFDLIHSSIVFQHIPPNRGLAVFERLLERLEPGGLGVVHFTYAREHRGKPFVASPVVRAVRRRLSWVKRVVAWRSLGQPSADPEMQMNAYELRKVIYAVQSLGCDDVHLQLTNHQGQLGAVCYFRRPKAG